MESMIILADLGRMKAYRVTRDDLDPNESPAFEDIADVDLKNQHSRVSDRVTDKAGRFSYGPGSKSVGERHNEQEEAEIQQLRGIVNSINRTVNGANSAIYLAAPKEIISNLVETLDPAVRKRIRTKLALNLVKAPKLELLERFSIA